MKPLPIFRRVGMSLVPASPEAARLLGRVGDGERCVWLPRRPRNIDHHRKMFGIFKAIVEATGQWPSTEKLLDDVMVALGKGVSSVNAFTGERMWTRDSIAFENMAQDEFADLYEEIMRLLTSKLGFHPETLLDEGPNP